VKKIDTFRKFSKLYLSENLLWRRLVLIDDDDRISPVSQTTTVLWITQPQSRRISLTFVLKNYFQPAAPLRFAGQWYIRESL
jgi:hypothetical protein